MHKQTLFTLQWRRDHLSKKLVLKNQILTKEGVLLSNSNRTIFQVIQIQTFTVDFLNILRFWCNKGCKMFQTSP